MCTSTDNLSKKLFYEQFYENVNKIPRYMRLYY